MSYFSDGENVFFLFTTVNIFIKGNSCVYKIRDILESVLFLRKYFLCICFRNVYVKGIVPTY